MFRLFEEAATLQKSDRRTMTCKQTRESVIRAIDVAAKSFAVSNSLNCTDIVIACMLEHRHTGMSLSLPFSILIFCSWSRHSPIEHNL